MIEMEPFKIGRYQVTAEIGRGGMATVYRAYDAAFEREVAIKILPSEFLHDPTFRARFSREAKIIGALEHVAIVPVYDFGEEDGQPFLVMRLMTGGSLADRIRLGRIPLAEAARILARIAKALDEAHAKGVIHRDLKPGNILFDQHDEPFLADFGIARLVQGPTLTSQYATVGTPAYMSPEQGRGDPDVDGRSDLYALGSILFEMLSGRVPYEAETPTGQIIKHITDPIPNLLELCTDCPPDCQALINCAMAKKKEDRFTTAMEMAQALSAISQGSPLSLQPEKPPLEHSPEPAGLRPTALPAGPPRFWKRLPLAVWFGLGAFMLLFLLAVVGMILFPAILPKSRPTPSNTPWPSPTASQAATLQPTAGLMIVSATLAPSLTPVPSASRTSLPTATLTPAPTETITVTPLPVAVVSVGSAFVRTGPGTFYPVILTSFRGRELQVIGRNTGGTWLAILLPDKTQTGWIALSNVDIPLEVMLLPVVTAPPTLTPKPAPTRTEESPSNPQEIPTTPPYP
jgi:serine/threonine protein kinase